MNSFTTSPYFFFIFLLTVSFFEAGSLKHKVIIDLQIVHEMSRSLYWAALESFGLGDRNLETISKNAR